MEKIIIIIKRLRNCNIVLLSVLSKVREYIVSENENILKVLDFGLFVRRYNFLVNIYCFVFVF